ncbi:MAG: DUF1444 family protein [Planctomycetales bacterium]
MNGDAWVHWVEHEGPGGSFRISLPPTWKTTIHTGSMIIEPATGSGYLTLRFQSLEELGKLPDKRSVLRAMFPARRKVHDIPSPHGDSWKWGLSGDADLDRPRYWWSRMFRRKNWRPWVMWFANMQDKLCLALYLRKNVRDYEEENLIRMALATLKFSPPRPRDSVELLQHAAVMVQRKFPRKKVSLSPPWALLVDGVVIDMKQAWAEFEEAPEQLEAIIWSRLWPVLKTPANPYQPHELTWEAIQNRIMPMLCVEGGSTQFQGQLIANEWVAGLSVTYVLDEPHSYRYIHRDLFRTWGVSLEHLHAQALTNLERYFDASPMEFAVSENSDAARLLLPVRADAYNASRLLSEKFQQKLRDELGAEYAVGLPSRDFFVAVSLNSTDTLEWMKQRITDDFQQLDHPLSKRLLLITSDGVSELTDSDDESFDDEGSEFDAE